MHKLRSRSRHLRGQRLPRLESLEDRNVLAGFGLPTDLLLAGAATPPLQAAQVSTAQPTLAAQATSNSHGNAFGLTLKLELTGDANFAGGHLVAVSRANSSANFSLRFGLDDINQSNGGLSFQPFGQRVKLAVFLVIRGQDGDGDTGGSNPGGGNISGNGGNTGSGNFGSSTGTGTPVGNGGFFISTAAPTTNNISNPSNSTAGTSGRLTLLDGTTTSFLALPANRALLGVSSVNGVGGQANDLTAGNLSLGVNVVPRTVITPLSSQVGGAAQQEEEDQEIRFEDLLPKVERREERPDVDQGMADFATAVPESQGATPVSNFQVVAPGVLESALGEAMVEVKAAGGEVAAWLSDYRLESWMAGLAVAGSMLEVARQRSQDEEQKETQKMPNRRLDQPKDE